MSFDPGVYSQIQGTLISTVNTVLSHSVAYSQNLLYVCASLEIVLFALWWMLQGQQALGRLVFSLLKVGFLLMVVNEFTTWLSIILASCGQLAAAADSAAAFQLLTAPGEIWQYGYDSAMVLLKKATVDGLSMGLSLLLTSLGLGILLVYGLLGARLIVQIAVFYFTALIALIVLPLGVLKPTADFAYRAFQSVLQSGVALLALMLVLTVATTVWQGHDSQLSDQFNLNQVLAIFFSGLVFLLLAQLLPKVAAQVVGRIQPLISDQPETAAVTVAPLAAPPAAMSDLRAATTLESQMGGLRDSHFAAAINVQPAAVSSSVATSPMKPGSKQARGRVDSATTVSPSISASTLQKLANTRQASGD